MSRLDKSDPDGTPAVGADDGGVSTRWASSKLGRGLAAWNGFWFAPQPPHSLAVFRILLGLFFLVSWLLRAPYVARYFSGEGIHAPMYPAPAGGLAGVRHWTDLLGYVTQPVSASTAWCIYVVLLVSLVLFTLGYRTFVANLTFLLLYFYFYCVSLYQLGASYDRLFLQITGLMLLSRSDAIFSLSARRRRWQGRPVTSEIAFWPARLIGLQIMAVYVGTGWNKIFSEAWHGGEVLHYALIGGWASPVAFGFVRLVPDMWFYDVAVFSTIAFELFAPIGLYASRCQPWFFTAGFMFHLGIAVTLQIWQFLAMPAAYILFVEPSRVRDLCETCARGVSLRARHIDTSEP